MIVIDERRIPRRYTKTCSTCDIRVTEKDKKGKNFTSHFFPLKFSPPRRCLLLFPRRDADSRQQTLPAERRTITLQKSSTMTKTSTAAMT